MRVPRADQTGTGSRRWMQARGSQRLTEAPPPRPLRAVNEDDDIERFLETRDAEAKRDMALEDLLWRLAELNDQLAEAETRGDDAAASRLSDEISRVKARRREIQLGG